MSLHENELAIIREEMLAQAEELHFLTAERAERRCRVMALILADAGMSEAADAARTRAVCYSTGRHSTDHLIKTIRDGK